MAYEDNKSTEKYFVKTKDGVKAPNGFHYMPSGKLMSDADHIAVHGYIEQKITSFNVDSRDILNEGETRSFYVSGDKEAIFSFEIYDNTGKYYNFDTKTWSTEKAMLSKKKLNGTYAISVKFDALPDSSLKTYTINLFAETVYNTKTIHADFGDFRNADNSININKTTGSNSSILTRIIYQDAIKTLKISCVAPSLYDTSADAINGATSSTNRIVIDGDATDPNVVQVGDKITTTGIASAVHALVTKVDPDGDNENEIEMSISDSATNDAAVTFTPAFNGMTPHDADSDTGTQSISVSSGNKIKTIFSISITPLTGRTFSVIKTPTVNDLCAYTTVTFESAALAIENEDVSSSTYYRWPITNIASLGRGMALDSSRSRTGGNTTSQTSISNYKTTTTKKEVIEGEYNTYIKSVTVDDISVGAVDAYGNDVTAVDRKGRITAQKGNIVFNKQQADALKSDTGVRIFAYGANNIETLTGVRVALSNVTISYQGDGTTAATSTTTTSGVDNSTTIPLTEVGNISQGMTISGVGINPAVANPVVSSKNAISGAGNVIASAAQTLESGQTLFFEDGATTVTVRGNIEISNMAINNISLFFDVERFLTAS